MANKHLLQKIETAQLKGKGGAAFSVFAKWKRIGQQQAASKYVVCNASEGEPGVRKDFHILENYPEKVFAGMLLAMDFLESKQAYLYINRDYYQKLKEKIDPFIKFFSEKGLFLSLFQEEPSYIGGETGSLLNAIEGKKTQPRLTPPSASLQGINGVPVLSHNVETFYDISLVAADKYEGKRFVTISGTKNNAVFALDQNITVKEALEVTNNWPDFPFFTQVGGGASGVVINQEQTVSEKLSGCASIEVYPLNTAPKKILKQWADFYQKESCGKCTPCREGSWQLAQMIKVLPEDIKAQDLPVDKILPIIESMAETSFCALGESIALPVKSYLKNVLNLEFEEIDD